MKIYTQAKTEGITAQHFQFDNSFGPFIRFLRDKQEKSTDIRQKFYRYLIKKFEQHPELLVPFKNVEMVEEHEDLVQLLRMSVLPLSANTEDIPMALAFLQPSSLFYYTSLFKQTFIDEQIEFNTQDDVVNNLRYFVKLVLERCYHVRADVSRKIIKQVINHEQHTLRHHQLNVESRFIDVHYQGELPPYNEEWQRFLNVDDAEFIELFKSFPSQQFRLEGFCMLIAEDVSEEIAVNQLKNAVLNMHNTPMYNTLEAVEAAVAELVNDSEIRIGITPFFKLNGRLVFDQSFNTKCVGIGLNEKGLDDAFSLADLYEKFTVASQPYIFQQIDEDLVASRPYLCGLLQDKIKSFMVYPIKSREGLIGVFELGSPVPGQMTAGLMNCLQPALPLITDLVRYMIETFDTRITRLVKEKFTPLQESVEWKFNEVAWEYLLHKNDQEKEDKMGNVVFEDVYPLYGAVDIRNSSVERNLATKNDYLFQLEQTSVILKMAAQKMALPLMESIQYKCGLLSSSISDNLSSEDEIALREFLEQEVFVLFRHIAERDPEYAKLVNAYMKNTALADGDFHQNHRNYEESVALLNKTIVRFFDEESQKLQQLYPFYFEKYRTDGVEYNMYIGQSIAPNKPFNAIFIKNLRAWQVSSMAQVARLNYGILSRLPLPLQTTQLILVHGNHIDISFRKDERRFDVEGAYNIRYEILKKRIDKVRVKGTLERLTQPDKIAIVYSNSGEIQDYLHHIQYLQNIGQLTSSLEMLELENVQGVSGLKAIRVGVQYEDAEKQSFTKNLLQSIGLQ